MTNPNFPLQAGYNLYIGARYVPKFEGEYDATKAYDPLTIVGYQGDSYTSKTFVPIGIAPDPTQDTDYWAKTGNYNVQIEQYRQQLQAVVNEVGQLTATVNGFETAINEANQTAADAEAAVDSKAAKSATVQAVLPSASWVGNVAPYTMTITVAGVTAAGTVLTGLGGRASASEYTQAAEAQIVCSAQGDGSLSFRCYGRRPTVNIPIDVVLIG